MAKYQSTKTYGTDRGLSCCFRQWKANHSHCSTLHGYSLGFKFVFESETLDEKNWCFDFGGMKPIKAYLDHMFDHTILVAEDDPARPFLEVLASFSTSETYNGKPRGKVQIRSGADPELDAEGNWKNTPAFSENRVCDLRIVPGVGCELTAKLVYDKSVELLEKMKKGELGRYAVNPDVRLVSVECFEHGANSAIYYGDDRKVFYVETSVDKDVAADYIEKVKKQILALKDAGAEEADIQYFEDKLK